MRPVQAPLAPLPERTLSTLMLRFAAGDPLTCQPLSQGLLNRGYRLTTTRGRFFLKQHLDDPQAVTPVVRRHRATAALAGLGLPVTPPVAAPDGRTVTFVGGRCYALHPWVEGHHRSGRELGLSQCRRLGTLLGEVHRGLERVIPLPSGDRDAARCSASPEDTRALIDRLLARVRARRRRDGFDELAEHRLTERHRILREYAHLRPRHGEVPSAGWVHGDFHPLNLLYRDGGPVDPVAIIDWDRLAVQPRAEEAVRAAAIFFLRPDGGLELEKVRAYSRAYRESARAPESELAAAVHRVWWERLNDFWMLRWRYELRDGRPDPQFPAASALVVWWTRHSAAVRDAFCD
ncbi:phosphotransferase [Streptomyces sodiiphilus]|uniref:Phosphotransferase n=1 Tax=Streptomyces sodiiphilus TaxID=226217 RepID=A0ABN2P4H6_9ACTN